MLNYTSGLLVTNGTEPKVVNTSRQRLADVPLGDPLGIPGAPDSLPTADDLLPAKWTICSQQPQTATPGAAPRSLLAVGDEVTDGTVVPVPDARTLPAQMRGLLVSDPTGQTYLVYGTRRFPIPQDRVQQTRTRFGWADTALPVATAWINAVPAGPTFAAPAISDRGDRSPVITDYDVGQILRIPGPSNGTDQWGVVMSDGVADITDAQALLMQTDPQGYEPKDMDANRYGNLPRSQTSLIDQSLAAGFPPAPPALLGRPVNSLCLTYSGSAEGNLSIRLDPTIPPGTAVPGGATLPGGVQADVVHVPRGRGALVVAAASPSAPASSGTVSIVTDTGRRYPLANRDVLAKLGFAGVTPGQVPAQLIALLPQGPSLDPTKARQSRPDDGG